MSVPRRIHCTVAGIEDHGGRVYTVDLAPASVVPAFRPGQFLHLTVDPYDPSGFWPESRVFSIASPPSARNLIRICYSVKGAYTTRMEKALHTGESVWIKLPYGDFEIDPGNDAVLLAGGTGISAFTAFLDGLTPEGAARVMLVYGVRATNLFLFKEMIIRRLRTVPRLRTAFFTETADPCFFAEMAGAPNPPLCFKGRISAGAIWPWIAEPMRATYYLSGPPAMLNTLTAELTALGVSPSQVRTDAWE